MDARITDLITITRRAFPDAVALHLEEIPERAGYMLADVELAPGEFLTDHTEQDAAYAALHDATYPIGSQIDAFTHDPDRGVHVREYGAVAIKLNP
jgi:hypothetical protein